jgi:hypothetical protein
MPDHTLTPTQQMIQEWSWAPAEGVSALPVPDTQVRRSLPQVAG